MAHIIPFKAVRPQRTHAALVGSRSFIDYSDDTLRDKLLTNPYSFLHVIFPDFGEVDWSQHTLESKFKRVREKYIQFMDSHILARDPSPCFYIYQQHTEQHTFTGVIAGVALADYREGSIKVHEHTLTARENMFKTYLKETRINAEPVLMSYADNGVVDSLLATHLATRPEYEFATTDGIEHRLWLMDDPAELDQLQHAFEQVDSLYIADGHHRSASSALLADEVEGDPNHPWNHFMCYLLPESQLDIREFNRLVKDLGEHTEASFLKKLSERFTVIEQPATFYPAMRHQLGLYMSGRWYALTPKPGTFDAEDPVCQLDCAILSDLVLGPILGITDPKTDTRLDFVGGYHSREVMMEKVDAGKYRAGFALFPVTVDQLKQVADNNGFMPPKSTWVEPKLRSGLVVYEL